MSIVKSLSEIQENIETFNSYLESNNELKQLFAKRLIKNGQCFVSFKVQDGYKFYPSKFIGYIKNSSDEYTKETYNRDGRLSNAAISAVIGKKQEFSSILENEFLNYCESLGIIASKKNRKYWTLSF